ncbi:MAG: sigma-70 family RNA polymerase sigma factor [Clostridia bacterium]|nr:sigma-70 family RNA polymerase sigma factor [Clostridia bacterium]
MDNFQSRTDCELVALFRGGEKGAVEELLGRYKNTVLSVARRYFLVGGDTEDLVQEGMCGLYSAITCFEGDSGFNKYAYACIKNRIRDAVKKSVNNKNYALNRFLPYLEDGDGMTASEFTPEEALIGNETVNEFFEIMKSSLSPLEYKAIRMYIDGLRIAEISVALNSTYKQTDNALRRAKHKLRRVLNK